MEVSICLDPGRTWPETVRLARHAELVGAHTVFVCDHFMPFDGTDHPVEGPVLEALVSLAALAGLTERVRLGTLVLGNAYRHPAVVANMAATLDRVSGGRLVLGLGAGWQVNEHEAYGIELWPLRQRMDRFDEACSAIRSLLREQRSTMGGTHYRLIDAPCDPKPVQKPLPLLVGGGGERRTLATAARFADEWHVWGPASRVAAKRAVLDRHCAAIDRSPAEISTSSGAVVEVTNTSVSGLRAGGPDDIVGTPAQVIDGLANYVEAGVAEFILRDDAAVSVDVTQDQLSVLFDGVVPHVSAR